MKPTLFDPFTGKWNRPFPECISQYDVAYQSPPEDAMQGLPLGNGDLGLLIWTEGRKLVAAVNKVNLFDDSPECGSGMVGDVKYGCEPAQCHGARLTIDFGMPVFDILFLKKFQGRLGLADASAVLEAETPFQKAKATSFVSSKDKVIVLKCEAQSEDGFRLCAELERYGSRTYSSWYDTISRDVAAGLGGTETTAEGRTITIRQKTRSMEFDVCARAVSGEISAEQLNRRAGLFSTPTNVRQELTILLTVVTSEESADPRAEAKRILDRAEAKGLPAIFHDHAAEWERFWQASFLSIPDKYAENIWFLNLYYANSSCRGAYPPRFINGIWGWNRDVSNWAYYFHWNMQNFIWPLHTANHAELALPYYRYRSASLENAQAYARNRQKLKGAFFADVSDRKGRNVGKRWDNETPGAQIALLFWEHWLYTGDTEFLRNMAWPILREVARYYASLVEKGGDNIYRSPCSQAYEGSPLFSEVITDTAMIRALMPAAAECARLVGKSGAESDVWNEIGARMNPFYTLPLEESEEETSPDGQKILRFGLGKGKPVLSGRAFAVGKFAAVGRGDPDKLPKYMTDPLRGRELRRGELWRCRYGDPQHSTYYGIPDPEFAPVFPSGVIGLKDRDTALYRVSVDQARLHPRSVLHHNGQPETDLCMGWCPYPVVLARLGLAEEAAEAVRNVLRVWQFYCQGFGHYGPYERAVAERDERWYTNRVRDEETGETFSAPGWPFRHFDLEAVPIVCTAMNEMLLQSFEGFLRLLPAVPKDSCGSFMLAAEGGFLVSVQFSAGVPEWVAVESRNGGFCRMVKPWEGKAYLTVLPAIGKAADSAALPEKKYGPDILLEFPTEKGSLSLLTRDPDLPDHWQRSEAHFEPNRRAKENGGVWLGIPKMF